MDIEKEIAKKLFCYAEKYNKKIYCPVSNISIASERRDFLRLVDCFVCNDHEAEMLFYDNFEDLSTEEILEKLKQNVRNADLNSMVVTLGERGAVWADKFGESGYCPAKRVDVRDTTGAGDSFFAGVASALTYGKSLDEACEIGSRLAASVITTTDNVCPRFLPEELGL